MTLAILGLAVAGCGGKAAPRATVRQPPQPWWVRTPLVEFGFIKSLTPLGRGYELRLDLHLRFGPDRTGIRACIDDHACAPGTTGLPDDTYDHDLNYVVTYYVPPETPVELVGANVSRFPTVTAQYFYGMGHDRNPHHVGAFALGPDALKEFGFYVAVSPSSGARRQLQRVTRMGQVFHP